MGNVISSTGSSRAEEEGSSVDPVDDSSLDGHKKRDRANSFREYVPIRSPLNALQVKYLQLLSIS